MIIEVYSEDEMKRFGAQLGVLFVGGELIELVGDVGAGKTTLTKGIASGLAVDEDVQSPSFTISRIYTGRDDLTLAHYDFYRLADAGIMSDELQETLSDPLTVTVLEWGGVVEGVLPADRLTIALESPTESSRRILLTARGPVSQGLVDQL